MISSDGIRGYNDAIILSILNKNDSYGYEISKTIRERTNDSYVIKETTLYSVFARLEKNQLIVSYPGEVTHGKKRTYYKITEIGRNLLEEKKARVADDERRSRSIFGGKLNGYNP